MKLFHLSDLHIGKQLNGCSLKENQTRMLEQIVQYAKEEHPDVILVCGDIYDKSAPSGEAYQMFDRFLDNIAAVRPEIPVLIIAGNHDSPERLDYAASFLEQHQIYFSVFPPQKETEYLKKVELQDEYGSVHFYLMPFLKPGYVKSLFPEETLTYETAVQKILEREKIDSSVRNVLLSHQFYAAGGEQPETCESETAVMLAGGLDRIDVSVLDAFDYAALGHLHGAQRVGREEVRYCGTPYKYSISEEHHRKSVTVVTLQEKGTPVSVRFLPLQDIQDVRRIRGTVSGVLEAAGRTVGAGDYVSITITDEEEIYRTREMLEEVYEHILELKVDNSRTRRQLADQETDSAGILSPLESFSLFCEALRGEGLSEEEQSIMEKIIAECEEEL